MKLTVASYNVQHFLNYHGSGIDYDAFAGTVSGFGADLVGLNEVRGKGESEGYDPQAAIMGEKTGYDHYFAKAQDMNGKRDPYGNAFLSRFPIEEAETVLIPYPEDADSPYPEVRSILKAVVKPDGKPLTVFVTHLGVTYREQEAGIGILLPLLGKERTVLMGDFNLTPDCPLLDPVRERMKDADALLDGEKKSWPSDLPERKIDYLFTSPDLRILSADIPDIETSDHRPYLVEIEI